MCAIMWTGIRKTFVQIENAQCLAMCIWATQVTPELQLRKNQCVECISKPENTEGRL